MRSRHPLVFAGVVPGLVLLLVSSGAAANPSPAATGVGSTGTASGAGSTGTASAGSPATGGRGYGPVQAMHAVVLGDAGHGYRAEIYDGRRLVARRGLTGDHDLTVLPGSGRNQPAGPDLLGASAGQLSWQGPVQNGVGAVPGTVSPTTTPDGASAVRWTQSQAGPDTWIYVNAAGLTAGTAYRATVTLTGAGTVFLDTYDGRADGQSATVTLTGTPQTLTHEFTKPANTGDAAQLQIRTRAAGPVDLVASGTSLRAV